jgi:hypothetical protein
VFHPAPLSHPCPPAARHLASPSTERICVVEVHATCAANAELPRSIGLAAESMVKITTVDREVQSARFYPKMDAMVINLEIGKRAATLAAFDLKLQRVVDVATPWFAGLLGAQQRQFNGPTKGRSLADPNITTESLQERTARFGLMSSTGDLSGFKSVSLCSITDLSQPNVPETLTLGDTCRGDRERAREKESERERERERESER